MDVPMVHKHRCIDSKYISIIASYPIYTLLLPLQTVQLNLFKFEFKFKFNSRVQEMSTLQSRTFILDNCNIFKNRIHCTKLLIFGICCHIYILVGNRDWIIYVSPEVSMTETRGLSQSCILVHLYFFAVAGRYRSNKASTDDCLLNRLFV